MIFNSLAIPSAVSSTYSSELTTSTERYSRDQCQSSDYYYQALKIDVGARGFYKITIHGTIHMHGYLYQDAFNRFEPSRNLLLEHDESCGKLQISLKFDFSINTTYVLVVTTYVPGRTGDFRIQTFGAANITFTRIREYILHSCQ